MNFLTKLFKKKPVVQLSYIIAFNKQNNEIRSRDFQNSSRKDDNQYLTSHHGITENNVKVIYSKDRWMRYVVLKDEKEFFTYQLEAIYQYDEDEWKYICSHDNVLPAMWEPFRGIVGKSVFENIDELLNELKAEPEYKQYF